MNEAETQETNIKSLFSLGEQLEFQTPMSHVKPIDITFSAFHNYKWRTSVAISMKHKGSKKRCKLPSYVTNLDIGTWTSLRNMECQFFLKKIHTGATV